MARVIQNFVDTLSDSALVGCSNQKFFVTGLRADDCIADSMRRQLARKDKEKRKRQQQWWGKPWDSSSAVVSPPGPVESSGDQPKPKGKGKEKKKGTISKTLVGRSVSRPTETLARKQKKNKKKRVKRNAIKKREYEKMRKIKDKKKSNQKNN